MEVSLPGPTHTLPGHPVIQLGVGQPEPFVYTSPVKIQLLLNEELLLSLH